MQHLPSGDSFSQSLNFENFVNFVYIRETFEKGRFAERVIHYLQEDLYYSLLFTIKLSTFGKVNKGFQEKIEPDKKIYTKFCNTCRVPGE